jgi:hypothetical protein
MNPFAQSTSGGAPGRGGHLGRLHGNLLDLDDRLREAVAGAIGQAAAGVVRQVMLALLSQADGGPSPLPLALRGTTRARPLWQTLDEDEEQDRPPWLDETEEHGRSPWPDEAQEAAFLPDRDREGDVCAAQPCLWRRALGVALPVLGWWLHRQASRRAVGATLGCGVVCGLALYLGGRKAGGTGLALTLLTESVGAVATLGVRDQP